MRGRNPGTVPGLPTHPDLRSDLLCLMMVNTDHSCEVLIEGSLSRGGVRKNQSRPPPLVAHISNLYSGVDQYVRPIDSSLSFWLN